MVSPTTAMATMDTTVMPIPMPMDTTMARGLLLLLMLTMGTTMAMVLLTMDMDTVSPTTDMPVPTPMATMDTMARGLLMLPPLLMLKHQQRGQHQQTSCHSIHGGHRRRDWHIRGGRDRIHIHGEQDHSHSGAHSKHQQREQHQQTSCHSSVHRHGDGHNRSIHGGHSRG